MGILHKPLLAVAGVVLSALANRAASLIFWASYSGYGCADLYH